MNDNSVENKININPSYGLTVGNKINITYGLTGEFSSGINGGFSSGITGEFVSGITGGGKTIFAPFSDSSSNFGGWIANKSGFVGGPTGQTYIPNVQTGPTGLISEIIKNKSSHSNLKMKINLDKKVKEYLNLNIKNKEFLINEIRLALQKKSLENKKKIKGFLIDKNANNEEFIYLDKIGKIIFNLPNYTNFVNLDCLCDLILQQYSMNKLYYFDYYQEPIEVKCL